MLLDQRFIDDAAGGHQDIDLLLEGDDGEDVVGLQHVHDVLAGALDVLQRLALHAAGAVDQRQTLMGARRPNC